MGTRERCHRKYFEDEHFQSLNAQKGTSAENDSADYSWFPKMIRHKMQGEINQ